MNRRFLWGSDATNKPHLVNWETVCQPRELGGLDLRSARENNQALVTKLGWQLISDPNKPWFKALLAKYLKNGSLINCSIVQTASVTWKNLLRCRSVLQLGLRWRIGDGQRAKFWQNIWVGDKPLHEEALSPVLPALMDIPVSHAITPSNEWNEALLRHLLPGTVVEEILAIPIPIYGQQTNRVFWNGLQDGMVLEANILVHTCAPRWVRWIPPAFPFLKLNTNGALNHSTGRASAGRLLRDHEGRWLYGFAINIGPQSSHMAELWGCRSGLHLAYELGISHLVLEMDSLLAVQMIQARKPGDGLTSVLLLDIFHLLNSFTICTVQHTLREGNSAADFLASIGQHLTPGTTFFSTPPVGIGSILHGVSIVTSFLKT
ncbi:hypothetical protein SLEP1_g26909 [Rubroshorea leprosula]|uniref:RNase H type-1 domain-containing protein n=1 Tax=Rubroshorea leprosula TaxID=152421 RepID=A0AAV5JXY0_9ROSI|nr:hypothetical protein SLEP1_g26909 [Rubroshorea leprosula]